MREAMEATTKGTAAGLSAKQMEQLGEVANKASKALGIAMPDAISRLTRGISKLEPELLDELGLFTKIGPATENYARSIGKSTASLTDFEKRQAFANAVLKEGIDKFSAIEAAANPYDKLLASLKDLSFKALEIVNKVLVPLVNVLSQNPVALLGVLTAIGASIVKTAIPALGQYRENLKRLADDSRTTFTKMYSDQQMAFSNLSIDEGAKAEASFRNTKKTQDKIKKLQQEGSTFTATKKTDYSALASKDPFALTQADLDSLDKRAKTLARTNAAEADRLTKHLVNLRDIRAQSDKIGNDAAAKAIEGSEKWYSTAYANDRINKQKLQGLSMQTIRSNVAETQALLGTRAAWKKLNDETNLARAGMLKVQTGIDENGKAIMQTAPKINDLQAGYTKVAGSLGIVLQKIGTSVQAFGVYGQVIAAVVGTLYMVDSMFTKTEKEADAFSKAMGGVSDAVDNSNRTLTALAKQPGIATASIQGFLALSNASNTTTGAIEAQLDATKALLKALDSSIWDKATNWIAGLFGKDIASQAASNLARTVQSQLDVFRAAGMGDEAESNFKKAIGVNSLDLETLTTKFKGSTAAQDEFAKSNKGLNVRLLESSSSLQTFKSATEAVTKAYDEFIQSTASSNPLFKIGAALQTLSVSMQDLASKDISKVDAAFNELVDNPRKVVSFGQEFINQFTAIRQEFKTTLQEYTAYTQSIKSIQDQIAQKTEQKKNAAGRIGFFENGRIINPENRDQVAARLGGDISVLKKAEKTVSQIQLGVNTEVFVKARNLFTAGVNDVFQRGAKLIEDALGQSSQKAALTIAQAGLGALTGERAAQLGTRLKQDELKIQMQQLQTTIDLIASNTLLTATMNASNALMANEQAKNDPNASAVVKSERSAELLAAQIVKNTMGNVTSGKLKPEDIEKTAFTGREQVDKFIKAALGPFLQQIAQQKATGIEIGGKQKALGIEGDRARALGKLEDLNKERNLTNDINQQYISRIDILSSIDSLNSPQRAQERAALEDKILVNKQLQEEQGYLTAIKNANALNTADGREEARVQGILLGLVKNRQKEEKDNKALSDRIKFKVAELDVATKLNALNEALLDQDIARIGIVSSLVGFSSEQNVLATSALENEKLTNKFALERKKIDDEIAILQSETNKDNSKGIALKQTELALVTARQEKEKDNKGLQDALKLVEARFDLEQKLAGFRKTAADAQSQQAEDELNYRKELGLVTSFDAVKEKANIDRGRVARETAQEQASIDKDIAKKSLLEKKILEIEASGDSALAGDYEAVNNMTNSINAQSAALDATNKQKMNAIDLNEKLGSKMTGFSKIVENSFQSMADALADFARTGKLDFKALVDQMILDLIRFEMRAQMSSLFTAAGGLGGLMKLIGFGGASGMGASPDGINVGNNLLVQAKGGAYDTGLKTFAKGGMFTNSVVNQPTLFKFAQGTGLMGEAGPEAIMPLKRDSNGNLGVRSGQQGSNVDVVVNNYGNEKATTKETTDSRGNRRIEVIVGDMVASELSRPGSSVQQSLSNNYGNRPSVARR
jgi:lambda family phage tail tape measure protein